jgi:hypothetical protein
MKVIASATLLLGFLLSGCGDSKEQQTAKCELEAMRTYPSDLMATSPVGRRFMQVCMQAAGYEFIWEEKSCVTADVNAGNPYCYDPRTTHGIRQWWREHFGN